MQSRSRGPQRHKYPQSDHLCKCGGVNFWNPIDARPIWSLLSRAPKMRPDRLGYSLDPSRFQANLYLHPLIDFGDQPYRRDEEARSTQEFVETSERTPHRGTT